MKHGVSAYRNSKCRCAICRQANTTRHAIEKQKRLRRLVDGPDGRPVTTAAVPHGDRYTYANWGCRCRPCTEANSRYCGDYKRRVREAASA